jgi:DNA-binding NarL/FixJ family response regulator
MNKIKILLTDDHQLIRKTWAFVLNSNPRFEVIADTGSAEEAIQIAKTRNPDIILMDINMYPDNGFELTEMILKDSPGSKIIGLSMNSLPSYAKRMIEIGGYGYLTKNSSLEEMTKAIFEVNEGKKFFCEEIKNILANNAMKTDKEKSSDITALSKREVQIVKYIKKGFSSKEIAQDLKLSCKTVEVHRYKILKKLSLKNTASLVNFINNQAI